MFTPNNHATKKRTHEEAHGTEETMNVPTTPSPTSVHHATGLETPAAKIIPYTPLSTSDRLRTTAGEEIPGSLLSPATVQKRLVRQKVIDGVYSLLPPPENHHSSCWQRFNYVADEAGKILPYTCCKFCKDVYTYKGKDTGTKGMIHHRCKRLKSDEGEIGVTPNLVENILNGKTKITDFDIRGKESDPAVSAALASELLAQALNKDQCVYVPVNQEIRQVLLQSCISFICQDMRPIDTFVDNDFLDLLQTAINLGAKFGHFDVTRILLPNNNDPMGMADPNAVAAAAAAAAALGGVPTGAASSTSAPTDKSEMVVDAKGDGLLGHPTN
ncbi:hypothetical protein IWQ61_005464 [Dispira simplex]|nr:hypothetical protein IWQ61_005464 [Dispira simplex]